MKNLLSVSYHLYLVGDNPRPTHDGAYQKYDTVEVTGRLFQFVVDGNGGVKGVVARNGKFELVDYDELQILESSHA